MGADHSYGAVLDFWFGPLTDGLAAEDIRQRWFQPDAAFDNQCRETFSSQLQQAADGELEHWRQSAAGCLAYIVLCDQLPRNIHRGGKQAFAWDHLALAAARTGITEGLDLHLGWDQRTFFYMPFEHSEAMLDQHTSVGLFTALRDEASGTLRNTMGNNLRYAQQHRDIIRRFNRFPHRNQVLGRVSTAEEAAFAAGGNSFGQS